LARPPTVQIRRGTPLESVATSFVVRVAPAASVMAANKLWVAAKVNTAVRVTASRATRSAGHATAVDSCPALRMGILWLRWFGVRHRVYRTIPFWLFLYCDTDFKSNKNVSFWGLSKIRNFACVKEVSLFGCKRPFFGCNRSFLVTKGSLFGCKGSLFGHKGGGVPWWATGRCSLDFYVIVPFLTLFW